MIRPSAAIKLSRAGPSNLSKRLNAESRKARSSRKSTDATSSESRISSIHGRLMRIGDWEGLARAANFDAQDMAGLCPISLRHLERFFANIFDQTPRNWLRHLRCRIALELISQGWSNKAVAAELHFADPSHFCHTFKRVYGKSPQSFGPVFGAKVFYGCTTGVRAESSRF